MSKLRFSCTCCEQRFAAPAGASGREHVCPYCGTGNQVPVSDEAAPLAVAGGSGVATLPVSASSTAVGSPPAVSPEPTGSSSTSVALGPEPVIEVMTDGEPVRFEGARGAKRLRAAVARGEFPRESKARAIPARTSDEQPKRVEAEWSTLETVARADFGLRTLYQPVWAHGLRGLWIGVLIGCIVKALDTTVLFFAIDDRVGFMWLMVVGSILISRWIKFAPIIAGFICFKVGAGLGLFTPILGIMAVGSLFGAPAGLFVGTLVGYARRDSLGRAPDAAPESGALAFWGLVFPVVLLAGLTYVYLAIFQPWAMETLAG